MNWEAAGAIGEILGAFAVVLTLVYLAIQVQYAKNATADQNRLVRSVGVREMILAASINDELRVSQTKNWGLESYYQELAQELGVTSVEASRVEWANAYYYWMYWGQYNSTHTAEDLDELSRVISVFLGMPGMRQTWDDSPLVKPLLDTNFVAFVEEVRGKQT